MTAGKNDSLIVYRQMSVSIINKDYFKMILIRVVSQCFKYSIKPNIKTALYYTKSTEFLIFIRITYLYFSNRIKKS